MRKLFALPVLWKSGRLALALLRDERVPLFAKGVVGLSLVYALTPIDVVPDWLPVLGQMDDVALLAAGIALFIKLCPPEVVEEHEIRLGRRPSQTVEGYGRPVERPDSGPTSRPGPRPEPQS